MARFRGCLLGLSLAMVTLLAVAAVAAAKTCTYTDACSKKPISAYAGAFLYDSCGRAYSVSESCALAKVRVCRFAEPCRLVLTPRTFWVASGGVLDAGCGRWAIDKNCTATVAKACPQVGSSCNTFPLQGTAGVVLARQADNPCRPRAYVMGPACEYNRVARECTFRDACGPRILHGLWPGAVYAKCGKLYLATADCKERRL